MYKHCTTEESVLRQRQIEQCLQNLMQTIPYPQITIIQICQSAGVSRKSFYRYFGSKEDCLTALIDHSIIDGASYYLPEHYEELHIRPVYERFFAYWKQMRPFLDVLTKNNLNLILMERMMEYMEKEERNFHQYLGGTSSDSYEQILFIVSGLMSLVLNWHRTGYSRSISEMATIVEAVLPN